MSSLLSTSQRGLSCSWASYFFKLGDDGLGLATGIHGIVKRRHVHDMQQQARALQVAQELVAQPRALGCTLDQARDIGQPRNSAPAPRAPRQVWVQRRERVVGNLWPARSTAAMKVDLPALGMPSNPTSANTFSSSFRFLRSPGQPGVFWRRPVDGALETQVAEAAIAALGNGDASPGVSSSYSTLTRLASLMMVPTGIFSVMSPRQPNMSIHAMLATLGLMAARIAKVHQGVQIGIGNGKHMATAPTIAAIGATELFVLFVPERHAAIATIASGNVDKGFIDELHGYPVYKTVPASLNCANGGRHMARQFRVENNNKARQSGLCHDVSN